MILKNGEVFIDGNFRRVDIRIAGDVIVSIADCIELTGEEYVECKGKKVIPGLFDIHTHGCLTYDFSASSPEKMEKMCEFYASHGVTSVLATTMTNEDNQYKNAMRYIKTAMQMQKESKNQKGATIQGINMEGPFFGPKKKGAHDEQYLRPVSQELFDEFQKLSGNAIRLVDIDPCLEHAMDFIQDNHEKTTVSIAHTPCNYEVAKEAVNAGATHVTHLFNAMNPMLHREPGVVGAASEFHLDSEIICDGIHIHPAVIHLMFRAMPEQMILISDAIKPTGMPDGFYQVGGLPVEVKDGKAFLPDGTLAGSTITLFDGVKNAIKFGVPEKEAILSATYRPAKSVHLEDKVGSIREGVSADLLIVSQEYELEEVFVRGNRI